MPNNQSLDYNDLDNKPSINGVELTSDMELADIGILEMTPEMVNEIFLETFGYLL
jgi:hypothetical protein